MALLSSPTCFYTNNAALILVCMFLIMELSSEQTQFEVGFYSGTCPNAESIVSSTVQEAVQSDPTIAAALLRLHFHDCFVHGCDGSILIDKPGAEKDNGNHAGLRGFEVIERAKAHLEEACPSVVSCADIVALAARDSVALSNGPKYQVPTGRRDGRISIVSDANNMPEVGDSIQGLKAKFVEKGLNDKDLVLLSGAHTIGTTACFFLERRLYNFTPSGGSDPSINPSFLPELKSQCPKNGNVNVRLGLDRGSDRVFDDQILRNIRNGFAVIESDAKLYDDPSTRSVVDSYLGLFGSVFGPFFKQDFAASMVKMGMIDVKTGSEGEIRRVCAVFN